ncbi:hypothetical protein H3C61_00030 [Candidatus Gracilibacteria bacterium]|nr:hypothetical protein [Candidatus Gracilibacteria bacterium]
MIFDIENSLDVIYVDIIRKIETFGPKIIGGLIIFIIGGIISILLYKFLIFFFKKIKLNQIIDRLKVSFDEEQLSSKEESNKKIKNIKNIAKTNRFTDKIKVDDVVAKSASYYILVVFLRLSIGFIGIYEIEDFLKDVTDYLPNLFVGVLIGFFGIRFANFIYDVVYHTLSISKEKTANIIAEGARIIILFFTLMVFLEYTKIVSMFIINTILIGFISMLALAGGLAFGIGGKEIAREILESFKK